MIMAGLLLHLLFISHTTHMQILGSLLNRPLSEDERDTLLHQLVQVNKAGPDLIDTIISTNPSNEDSLILALGALARNNDIAIESRVVKELLRRLSVAKLTGDNNQVIAINYALSNTGSRLAIDALLSSLGLDDVDTQISVIRGLDVHLDQPAVQQALIVLMEMSTEDAVLEEVLRILKDAFNNKVLQDPSKELLDVIADMAIKIENANLYELLIQYLKLVGTNETQVIINTIMQQHNYGQLTNENTSNAPSDSRIKRGSNWDSTSSSYYNLVASYSQRRSDVLNYPTHKAYIWGDSYGISRLNAKVGVGAFVGAYCNGNIIRFKVFGKAVTQVHVLGKDYSIGHLEYADYTTDTYLYHKVYVKLGSSVLVNVNNRYDLSCRSSQRTLWDVSRTVFNYRYPYFIFVATITFYVRGTVGTACTAGVCMCPLSLTACANLRPSITLRVTGGAQAGLLVSLVFILKK